MKSTGLFLLILILGEWCFGQNILISNENNPNEPTIIIDPKKPNVILAASNLNNYFISKDTGRTWSTHRLTSSHGVWGDPVLLVDTAGAFYFFHLSNPPSGNWIDRIVCQKTTDAGLNWSDGSFTGLNGNKDQDKHWTALDPRNNTIYMTWTQFDSYSSTNPKDSSIILFSKSIDNGISWSTPKRINTVAGDCLDRDQTVEGAVPCVGPNGEVYVAWAGPQGIRFNKSEDAGNTWLPNDLFVDSIPGGWDYVIPGIYRCNGLPITACDLSDGPNKGTIYINWTDQRNGIGNTDVWLSKSTDQGKNWSTPTKVNTDASQKHQFFTWMTIDQTTGYLYFVFYDRRAYNDQSTDVYLAVSKDGGKSFINKRISESPFIPNENIFFGDYNNITVSNGIIRPIWTRLHNGSLSIWTHLINANELITETTQTVLSNSNLEFENFPNPANYIEFVSFKLHESKTVDLSIYNSQGIKVVDIISGQKRGYGKYIESIDLNAINLANGIYQIRLFLDHKLISSRDLMIGK
ncbi:MAG: T9SS type A sorting domain-containing protein [Saprospiraceae bacterium]